MNNTHLLAAENKPLLHGRDALLLLDPFLDLGHLIVRLDVQLDFFAG